MQGVEVERETTLLSAVSLGKLLNLSHLISPAGKRAQWGVWGDPLGKPTGTM